MRKAILKTLKSACVITTVTGLTAFAVQAAEDSQTTTGTSGYQTGTQSTAGEHSAKSFIKQAFQDNQTEIDLANVGMSKAQNAELKSFCQQLQQDHTQANKDLQPLAQKYGVNEQPSRFGERTVNKFEKETSGAEFDKKLATDLLKNHQKDITKFERASAKLQEPDVKQYADTLLTKLREHMQHAEAVARAVGVDQSTISSAMSKTPAVGGTGETEESGAGAGTSGKTDQGSGSKQLQQDSTTPKQ
jgi:putative membrane protein